MLLDADTGQDLFAENPDQRSAASLAKIMTMPLALEDCGRGRALPTRPWSAKPLGIRGRGRPGGVSAMFLEVGEAGDAGGNLLYGIGVLLGQRRLAGGGRAPVGQ